MAECSITDNSEYLDARIARTEALIAKIEDAIDALSTGAQMYQLDTGQTRQLVTKANLASLGIELDRLENRRATLLARKCGAGRTVLPGF